MEFTKKERFMIANQFRILELLEPAQAQEYAKTREIFEEGYENECEWAMEHIDSGLSSDIQKQVCDTLDMFVAIRRNYGQLTDKIGIEPNEILFDGYDGNDPQEVKMLGYARFLVEKEGKFTDVKKGQDGHWNFNSHGERIENYERMLAEWDQMGRNQILSKDQIANLLNASNHPRS